MKSIKLKFVDWPYLVEENNTFIEILSKKYKIIESENPEFIFYSDFGKEHLKYDCIRIYYTPENMVPDFNICDYAIGYHDIKFEDRFIRFPLYGLFKYRSQYELALQKHNIDNAEILRKTKFCNFVYSNADADRIRTDFFEFLNRYKRVDSGGRLLNNIGGPVTDKISFQRDYKFSITFENMSMASITSEKIVQAFASQTIPIYWGDPVIDRYFNEKAFINVHKYNSFEEVLERIKEIENNPSLFANMLQEPMLKNKDLDYEELERFLVNIFERGPSDFRRSNTLRGKWYQDYHKRMAKWDHTISKWQHRFSLIKKLNPLNK